MNKDRETERAREREGERNRETERTRERKGERVNTTTDSVKIKAPIYSYCSLLLRHTFL